MKFLITTDKPAGVKRIQVLEVLEDGADEGITNLQSNSIIEAELGETELYFQLISISLPLLIMTPDAAQPLNVINQPLNIINNNNDQHGYTSILLSNHC